MGRKKIAIKQLKTYTERRTTYGKRHKGLMKKGYELSVLSDVPMALLMFPPTKGETDSTDPPRKIRFFSRLMRFEDVLINSLKYEAPAHEDKKKADPEPRIEIPNKEGLIQLLESIKIQDDSYIPPPKEPGNQEGNSSPTIASEQGMQSPTDLQRDAMKNQLYSANRTVEIFETLLWLYRSYQDAPTKDAFLLDYCETKLNNMLLDFQQEKQKLVVQENRTRLLNARRMRNTMWRPSQQQQQQLLLMLQQQKSVHRDQASIEAFDHVRKVEENVMEENPSYYTHMLQSQMTSQYLDTQHNQGSGVMENYDVLCRDFNPTTDVTGPNTYIHQQSFGEYGYDANYFYYNEPYPEF